MRTVDYWTMKEIGTLYGATSHQIGRTLKDLGLRTPEGKPAARAFNLGLVTKRHASEGPGYCWAWHQEPTCALLEEAGFERTEQAEGRRNP
jgi:hypothetical protein